MTEVLLKEAYIKCRIKCRDVDYENKKLKRRVAYLLKKVADLEAKLAERNGGKCRR